MASAEESWFRIGLYGLLFPLILQIGITNITNVSLSPLMYGFSLIVYVVWLIVCSALILVPHKVGRILYFFTKEKRRKRR